MSAHIQTNKRAKLGLTISPAWRATMGLMDCACFLVSSTNMAYLRATRASAPQAIIMRILAMVSLATAEALASDYKWPY